MNNDQVVNASRIAKIKEDGGYVQENLPDSEIKCAVLANLFITKGEPGKVSFTV